MAQTFRCPNCGADIEYTGSGDLTVNCSYCGTVVPVPDHIKQAILDAKATQNAKNIGKYVLIFCIIVFGLPACVGVCATLFGVAASIFGVALPPFLEFFLKR